MGPLIGTYYKECVHVTIQSDESPVLQDRGQAESLGSNVCAVGLKAWKKLLHFESKDRKKANALQGSPSGIDNFLSWGKWGQPSCVSQAFN